MCTLFPVPTGPSAGKESEGDSRFSSGLGFPLPSLPESGDSGAVAQKKEETEEGPLKSSDRRGTRRHGARSSNSRSDKPMRNGDGEGDGVGHGHGHGRARRSGRDKQNRIQSQLENEDAIVVVAGGESQQVIGGGAEQQGQLKSSVAPRARRDKEGSKRQHRGHREGRGRGSAEASHNAQVASPAVTGDGGGGPPQIGWGAFEDVSRGSEATSVAQGAQGATTVNQDVAVGGEGVGSSSTGRGPPRGRGGRGNAGERGSRSNWRDGGSGGRRQEGRGGGGGGYSRRESRPLEDGGSVSVVQTSDKKTDSTISTQEYSVSATDQRTRKNPAVGDLQRHGGERDRDRDHSRRGGAGNNGRTGSQGRGGHGRARGPPARPLKANGGGDSKGDVRPIASGVSPSGEGN